MSHFCLDDYDCIGFDMDHTLLQYHLPELQEMIYRCLADHLTQKGYDESLITLENYKKYIDFSAKGVVFDYTRGNFMKIDSKGYVMKCSHGLKQLDEEEIMKEYGLKRIWPSFPVLKETMTNASGFAIIENYYVTPAIPLLSILVENADKKNNGRLESYLQIWKDVVEGFEANFSYKSFKARKAMFMPELIENPGKYVKKIPQNVINWLKTLRKTKTIALITHTFENLAEHLMKFAFSEDWKDHFDFIVGHANKPKFFQEAFQDRPFCIMNADEEVSENDDAVKGIEKHKFFLCGSSSNFEKEVKRHLNLERTPKIVYFGDSIKSDIYAPAFFSGWDTVTILEEMEGEEELRYLNEKGDFEVLKKKAKRIQKMDKLITASNRWGSFFYDPVRKNGVSTEEEEENIEDACYEMNTFLGNVVQQYSRLAIPILDYITDLPIEHIYVYSGSKKFKFHPYPPHCLDL